LRLDSPVYPPSKAFASEHVAVDDLHSLYVEQAGNPDGPPIVLLHGGPGGGMRAYYRQIADPTYWRIITFDQRGCAKSTPFGSLERNTTWDLVADIERLREHFGLKRWVVAGGSWGSTLALAYAETHPRSCAGLIVSGIFLGRKNDHDWWWNGPRAIFPEIWEELLDFLPPEERGEARAALHRRIMSGDPAVSGPAARALIRYEGQILDLLPNWERWQGIEDADNSVTMGRLYIHYESHDYFLEDRQLERDAGRLRDIPGFIINGRYDICTPPTVAYDLHKAWPEATFQIVAAGSHVWNDPALSAALTRAVDSLRGKL
jgi:proline iminopeptidase